MRFDLETEKIDALIQLAIKEDIGTGDITTENLFHDSLIVEGVFIAKENGVIAGLPVVEYFFSKLDKGVSLKQNVRDGTFVKKGETIASIKGSAKTLLSGERIALNFLQRVSGIATLTAQFVERIKPLKTAIMDTRKTIPGWRYLEKYAVAMGGGVNHRMGLYDQVLIKDNHLDILKVETGLKPVSTSSHISIIEKAVSALRQKIKKGILVEVETRTLEEVAGALKAGVDIILFDNMNIAQLEEVVKMVKNWKSSKGRRKPLTEASGNITLENVRLVAQTGVDRISVGAITHSAKALDISLEISRQ
ncbi:MAG: carboxylating nicotinate-nucleotide diphosphorylase [Planctomycetes bacterium]|uniref:carboxylating nicotinate-nucleotide diphosphorylase n=1 Tax=Candidatus Wunengus sp. YC65 TaxID=3367701 RepID=UPI001D9BDC01|nr:carboxylating nicotinate-nucleotide diphosphorylase [Planctomycetota bacterium]